MTSPRITRFSLSAVCFGLTAAGALVFWPWFSHLSWSSGAPALHGVPAFFLGCVVLVGVGALARVGLRCRDQGWRWCRTWEALRSVLVTLALLISLVSLFYSVELWRGKRAMARVSRLAAELNEPLQLASLKPPPIPDEENLASTPVLAALLEMPESVLDRDGLRRTPHLGQLGEVSRTGLKRVRHHRDPVPWMLGHPLELRRDLVSPITDQPTTQAGEADQLLAELSAFSELLGEIKEASLRPAYQLPWGTVNPLFSDRRSESDKTLLGFQYLLELRAVAALRTGRIEAAYEDLCAGLRIAKLLRSQPMLFFVGARAKASAHVLQPLWEGLQNRSWTAEQLAAMPSQLELFDRRARLTRQTRFQILTHTDLIESIIPTASSSREKLPWSDDDSAAIGWVRMFYPRGWSLQDQAALHTYHFRDLMPLGDQSAQPASHERVSVRGLLHGTSDPFFGLFLVPKVVQMTHDNQEYLLFEEVALTLAGAAVALERHRLNEGTYPERLDLLVPDYLPAVPTDPIDGAQLRYRVEAGSYHLYSVGLDRMDDGGTLPPAKSASGSGPSTTTWDWVWPIKVAPSNPESNRGQSAASNGR